MSSANRRSILLLSILSLLVLLQNAFAGVIFTGPSEKIFSTARLSPDTEKNKYESPSFDKTVQDKSVIFSLVQQIVTPPHVASASGIFGSDKAAIGIDVKQEDVKTAGTGTSLLTWNMVVDGTFEGHVNDVWPLPSGAASASTLIRGRIETQVGDFLFKDSITKASFEGFFIERWDIPRYAGAFFVNPGEIVTPTFDIFDYKLSSETFRSADIKNQWEIGRIQMDLRDDIPKGRRFSWSYNPLEFNGEVVVTATYPTDKSQEVFKGSPSDLLKLTDFDRILPFSKKKNEPPTDYYLRHELANPLATTTTLGFVTGTNGSYEKADLAAMTEIFVGFDEFLVPTFFDKAELDELYVWIDLMEWSTFETTTNFWDEIPIHAGRSNGLPGVLVGTSPIFFDNTLGFTTDQPFTGTVVVRGGNIDGRVIPEPSTIMLFGIGIAIGLGTYFQRALRRAPSPNA